MALSKGKPRLTADPSIGVGDLYKVLEGWLDEVGNNQLATSLKPPQGTTWKTAADPVWLCSLSSLWKKLVALAPNGVIPSKKNRLALEKLQEHRTVNTGKLSQAGFAEQIDEWIRIGPSSEGSSNAWCLEAGAFGKLAPKNSNK